MNPFARFPFMRYVFPFILGITLEVFFELPPSLCFSTLGIFSLTLLVFSYSKSLRLKYHYRYYFATALQLFWLCFGLALTSINNDTKHKAYFENIKDKNYLIVKLKEPLARKPKTYKTLGEVIGVYDGRVTHLTKGRLLIYFAYDSLCANQLYCGDVILVPCLEQAISGPKNPGEFSFKRFLEYQKIYRQIYLKTGQYLVLEQGKSTEILRFVYRSRDLLLDILNQYIDDKTERGVAGALLFGYKDELDSDVVDAYARTGTLHVLAVSGMHVAILYFVVSFIFKPLQKKKSGAWLSAFFTLLLIWFYSLLSGMAPSIIRASVMFTIIILGKVLRDDISIYNNLFTSACLLLCYDPYYLFDAGFQLSYLAVLGIVYFQPKIAPLFVFRSWLGKEVWTLITVSVAAQIATVPISLYYFNQFPNFFILSNLLIIPTTTLIMYAGILLIVISKITVAAALLGYCINKLIAFADAIIFKIQALPLAVTEQLYITKTETLALYLILVMTAIYFANANKNYLKIAFVLLLMLSANFGIKKYAHAHQHWVVLNAIKGSFSLNIIDGTNNILFCDTALSNTNTKIKTHFKGFWNRCGVKPGKVENSNFTYQSSNILFERNYVLTPHTSLYMIDENTTFHSLEKIAIEYLVIGRKNKFSLDAISQHFNYRFLVFDGSIKPWRKKKYIEEAHQLNISYYDLLREGAIVIAESP